MIYRRLCHHGELHAPFHALQNTALLDSIRDILQEAGCDSSRVASIDVQDLDDFLDGDRGVLVSPCIVVGRSANQGIPAIQRQRQDRGERDKTYANSASLANLASGMTDMLIMSPPHCRYILDSARVENAGPEGSKCQSSCPTSMGHCQGLETPTFHADYGLASVQSHRPTLDLLQDLLHLRCHKLVQLGAEWISQHGMSHDPEASEECVFPDTFGPIDDLIRDDEMTRSDLFAQRTDGRESNDGLAADMSKGGYVRPRGDFGGGDGMFGAMTRDEGDEVTTGQRGDGDR